MTEMLGLALIAPCTHPLVIALPIDAVSGMQISPSCGIAGQSNNIISITNQTAETLW
jgi:hypothetical protein